MSDSFSAYHVVFTERVPKPISKRKLPPQTRSSRKFTLVLDLDETLVHSSLRDFSNTDDVVYITSEGCKKPLGVKYRPSLFDFLNNISIYFDLVLFTASTKEYGEQVLKKIDPERQLIRHRFYREDCINVNGHYIKDLEELGREIEKVVILDNSVTSFLFQLNNGIPISSWFGSENDRELEKAFVILKKLVVLDDVRPVLNMMFNLPKCLEDFKEKIKKGVSGECI